MSTRRHFLFALAAARAAAAETEQAPEFRGVFPIMQTPYTEAGAVDFDVLAKETRWLAGTGTHGMVWPQLASEYMRLTFEERMQGMTTIVEAGRDLRPKIVLGVQADDAATAVRYAEHAQRLQSDAIIALPPRQGEQQDLDAVTEYYVAVGQASDRPLFIQAIGEMPVEYILELAEKVPTLRFVKDEAGHTLSRISEFRATAGAPGIFTGGHGRTLIDEMARGSQGNMPAASWVDLYASCWDLWHEGREGEAIDIFSKALLYITQAQAYGLASLSYVLHLRGVFKNWQVRNPKQRPLDAAAQDALRRTYEFVRPYLRA